jgi:hypothetical protein
MIFTFVDKKHLDIFIVLMLFDVLNFISKMLDYQPENKNRKSRKQNMGEVISPSYKILK